MVGGRVRQRMSGREKLSVADGGWLSVRQDGQEGQRLLAVDAILHVVNGYSKVPL